MLIKSTVSSTCHSFPISGQMPAVATPPRYALGRTNPWACYENLICSCTSRVSLLALLKFLSWRGQHSWAHQTAKTLIVNNGGLPLCHLLPVASVVVYWVSLSFWKQESDCCLRACIAQIKLSSEPQPSATNPSKETTKPTRRWPLWQRDDTAAVRTCQPHHGGSLEREIALPWSGPSLVPQELQVTSNACNCQSTTENCSTDLTFNFPRWQHGRREEKEREKRKAGEGGHNLWKTLSEGRGKKQNEVAPTFLWSLSTEAWAHSPQ